MIYTKDATTIIKHYEGFSEVPYYCPAGKLTIGYGETENVYLGQRITKKEATAMLEKKMVTIHQNLVNMGLGNLETNKIISLCSFVYNIGVAKFLASTLYRYIQQDASEETQAKQFSRWIYSKGKILPGLIKRRATERELFETGTFKLY